jgi:L-aminopeptidase/D-esterase-like protein
MQARHSGDGTGRVTNDTVDLAPRTVFEGRALEFDLPSVRIGVAEYDEGPTGCTVFQFPHGSTAAVDVRGGAHATIYTEALHQAGWPLDALCFAGGSMYGLEAATGVTAELFAQRGYSTEWGQIALVSGGIIFDYGARDTAVYPDKALGRAALRAAAPGVFPLGARGAGRSATVGKLLRDRYEREPAGQGAAFGRVGETSVGVFTVVNAVGGIVDRSGRVVRGYRDARTGERVRAAEGIRAMSAEPAPPPPGNTTLTLLVTNQRTSAFNLLQTARQVHASMARAIDPFHTVSDGDVLWAVTTNERPSATETTGRPAMIDFEERALGVFASELAWDAVLSCFGD